MNQTISGKPGAVHFAQDVRIILASAEFSRELTTSVLWLNEHNMNIRCVRLQPYELDDRIFIDVQQIILLPEPAEYQIRIIEKKRMEREAQTGARDWTRYDVTLGERQLTGLWERHAIYQVFRDLAIVFR